MDAGEMCLKLKVNGEILTFIRATNRHGQSEFTSNKRGFPKEG